MNISKGIESKEKFGNACTRNKRKVEQLCDGEEYKIKQTNNGAMGEIIETTRKEYKIGSELAKKWEGWGTCLKPAYESIIVARKPFKGSLVDNVIKNGIGGLNIDECRVSFNGDKWKTQKSETTSRAYQIEEQTTSGGECVANNLGRFPANLILTYDETDFEEVCGGFPNNKDGNNSRYFYCAKASRRDRDEGLEEFEEKVKVFNGKSDKSSTEIKDVEKRFTTILKNTHCCVKPTSLMQYLVRLVTPKNGIVLDPFMGSGSTGKAVMYENKERNANYKFIGIEKDENYCKIAEARIKYVEKEK